MQKIIKTKESVRCCSKCGTDISKEPEIVKTNKKGQWIAGVWCRNCGHRNLTQWCMFEN